MSMEELVEATDLREKAIKDCIKKLMKEYKSRDTVLEVAQVGTKYAMQLKPEYGSNVQKLAVMDIPLRVLKTAALIAYHQPIKQRELFEMVGYRTYDHVKALHELGLIRRRDSGRTKIITTTERFSEYFGISTTDRDEIKKWMIEKLNLQVPLPKEERKKGEEEDSGDEEDSGEETSSEDMQSDDNSTKNETLNVSEEDSSSTQSL